jgi:hypothetical protein
MGAATSTTFRLPESTVGAYSYAQETRLPYLLKAR